MNENLIANIDANKAPTAKNTMKLKIQLQHPNAKAPTYATDGAACFDLYAATINRVATTGDSAYPGHPLLCDTGVAFEVPDGYMLQVRSRSGLAFKHGIEAFHGTVDSDYRGTVQVLLTCAHLDDDEPPVKINPGDRIAQACLIAAPRVEFEVVEQLSLTERGAGGFGGTGGVGMKTLWSIHIPGPDEYHAAPSEAIAHHMATKHNAAMREYVEKNNLDWGVEMITCEVAEWPGSTEDHTKEIGEFDYAAWGLKSGEVTA